MGRVVATDVVAPGALPAFSTSAMDGYAVRAVDTAGATAEFPVVLNLVGEARAGRAAIRRLHRGDAHRISTGARLPTGADAVVRVEDTEEDGRTVAVAAEVTVRRDVRLAGEDVRTDDLVLPAGTVVHAGAIALLAGLGISTVAVRAAPTVSLVVTGDEVVRHGARRPSADAIHDVHGVAIPALVRAAGGEVVEVKHVGDDRAWIAAALAQARGDVVVTTGGISVGRHDHVRSALRDVGAVERASGVAMRPGGPTWFGSLARHDDGGPARPVFGLPGNPAAAMIGAAMFVVPAIRAMTGRPPGAPRSARLTTSTIRHPRLHGVLWGRLSYGQDGLPALTPAPTQGSHRLRCLAGSDVLMVVPHGPEPVSAGDTAWFLPLPGAGDA